MNYQKNKTNHNWVVLHFLCKEACCIADAYNSRNMVLDAS